MPFGRIRSSSVSPSGEGSEATLRMSAAIPAIRSGVSCNRSYIGSEGSLRAKSSRLAARISSDRRSAASATESSTRSIRSGSIRFSQREASTARSKRDFGSICFVSLNPYKDNRNARAVGRLCAPPPAGPARCRMRRGRRRSRCRRAKRSSRCRPSRIRPRHDKRPPEAGSSPRDATKPRTPPR